MWKVTDCLEQIPQNGPTDMFGYADDIMDMGTGIDEQIIVDNLQGDITKLEALAREQSLSFNADKTRMMILPERGNTKSQSFTSTE